MTEWIGHPARTPADRYRQVDPEDAGAYSTYEPAKLSTIGRTLEDQTIVGAVSGEFVTQTFEYDGGRQVTVYVPPDPPEAVVFAF